MSLNQVFKTVVFIMISLFTLAVNARDVEIQIDTANPGAKINKNIYGQFMEHLGRGIYEGIWVGEDSNIPNTKGYRNDVLKALKELQVPLLRWPGGCFADEYHWRDGIGPRDKRKVTVNTNWGGVTDDNSFGTHEFLELAEMLDAEVYVNGNLGTGTPREMAEWLEYMTSPSDSTLANLRRQNGREEPWKIHYFAIGNESWGCGGTMTPEFYANLYKQYATFLKTPKDNRPIMIASGGYNERTDWVEGLLEHIPPYWTMRMQAISHHYYTVPTGVWEKKGNATGFPKKEWISTMEQTLRMEEFIVQNVAIMDKYDPEKKIGFYVDEWGTWYDVSEGDNPGFLYQQNTLRDAVVASLNLDLFHKYSDRVHMSNIAQMVNVLQAMILTDKEKMLLTPTYHVFKMYIPFQDATNLPVKLRKNPDYKFDGHKVPQVSASAATTKDGKTVLALTNVDPDNAINVKLKGDWKSASGQLLSGKEIDSHNTFDKKDNVVPVDYSTTSMNGELSFNIPAKAIIVVELK